MPDELGLYSAVSMALGGMIGGGIYAVMGVVAGITTYAVWASFLVAGLIALCAGYSYGALNALVDDHGGSVTFVQSIVGNSTLAGMVGWTLLVGYVGSMAMYAFAFGEFAVSMGVPGSIAGVATRPAVSVAVVAAFVGLNLLGARSTGVAENVLVALKVAILVTFGALGLAAATGSRGGGLRIGLSRLATAGPVVAAAISFVAFQGWQLLFYDQESIADPVVTVRRAVYVSVPVAVAVYVIVGVVTVNLAPTAVQRHPHVALKAAAESVMRPYGLAAVGGTVLALSALFSTGSAINATLFSTAHFAKGMLRNDLLPDAVGRGTADGVPPRTVVVVGVATAALGALGELAAITSLASLSFIVVFGGVCYLALAQRHHDGVHPVPPAVGLAGTAAFLPLLLWNLRQRTPGTFRAVLGVAAALGTVEVLYFERAALERKVDRLEAAVLGDDESQPPDLDGG